MAPFTQYKACMAGVVIMLACAVPVAISTPYLLPAPVLAAVAFAWLAGFATHRQVRESQNQALEAMSHDFSLVLRSEEELLRLADAWAIVHHFGEKCEWEWHDLPQDDVVQMLSVLSAAVDGEQRCLDDNEFTQQRTTALAKMRMSRESGANGGG